MASIFLSILAFPFFLYAREKSETPIVPHPTSPSERLQLSPEYHRFFHEELQMKGSIPEKSQVVENQEAPSRPVHVMACADGGWRICLSFPSCISYSQSSNSCSLCLEFNQPIEDLDFSPAEQALQYLVNRFDTGTNTLLIAASRPLFFSTESCGKDFIIDIYPDFDGSVPIPRYLKIARAQLLIDLRFMESARCALMNLLKEFPDDRDVLVMIADWESAIPRWTREVDILRYSYQKYPYDTDIRILLRDAYFPHTSFVRIEKERIRYINEAIENFYRIDGEWALRSSACTYYYLGGSAQLNRGHISSFVTEEGTTEGFLGNRWMGKVYARTERGDGLDATGTVYITEGVVFGGGLDLKRHLPYHFREIGIIADWHKPYWDTYETFVEFGREDKVLVEFEEMFNRFFEFTFSGGVHRVGVKHIPNGWTSTLVNFDFIWNFYVTPNTTASLVYNFDAEYVYQRATRIDAAGVPFNPVPLTSYEFHTPQVQVSTTFWNRLEINVFAGETIDRLGSQTGINAGFNILYQKPCPCGWEIYLEASQFPSTTVAGATEQDVTAWFRYRF